MFKSQYLNDKHPVIVIKDMDFENLKSLVEYMYKGETNVAQPMLPAFIKDAESLQIRGLADFSNKNQLGEGAEHLGNIGSSPSRPPQHSAPQPPINSTPISSGGKKSKGSNSLAGGILAARLAKMSDQVPPPMSMFDFNPEAFPSMLRNPAFMAAAASAAQVGAATPSFPPPMKKSRKSAEPRPRGGSPTKDAQKKSKLKNSNQVINSNPLQTNNNFDLDEEGGLKIDEDADPGKENLEAANKMEVADDIAEIDNSNGVSEEEEEPSMPGPGGELAEAASKSNFSWPAFLWLPGELAAATAATAIAAAAATV